MFSFRLEDGTTVGDPMEKTTQLELGCMKKYVVYFGDSSESNWHSRQLDLRFASKAKDLPDHQTLVVGSNSALATHLAGAPFLSCFSVSLVIPPQLAIQLIQEIIQLVKIIRELQLFLRLWPTVSADPATALC